jgi:predicted unusual protein kinase regulating ubiquinone biosynthesis (AarF/ABC1/UbiB family)
VARVAPLVGLAGRTAGEAVLASLRQPRGSGDDTDSRTRAAQRYAERLGRSRGVLMKAGQIFSFVSPDPAVTGEFRSAFQAAFAKLQDDAPPMPAELAIETVAAELGRAPAEVFAEFDPHPLGAASIGQVHAARLADGRPVAVKVQYPGVEQAIRADLANTELLATFFQLMFSVMPNMTRANVRAMAREVGERIGEEVDYRLEAANQREFADAYRGHPFIRIPEVVPELSTRRVLVMDLVDGRRYAKATTAEQSLRDRWGEVIFRFVMGGMRRLRLSNADPHPGNYLFHPDGTVTFLDFGCVKRFTEAQMKALLGYIGPTLARDPRALYDWARTSEIIDPAHAPSPDALLSFCTEAFRYLLAPQPFTFTQDQVAHMLRARLSSDSPHYQVARLLAPPGALTLANRIEIGMSSVLGGLRATGAWNAMREEWDDGAPPATPFGELDAEFWAGRR